MDLQTTYKRFLATPNQSFLANNASLHYITTLVTVNGSLEIIKHLNSQSHDLTKKEEKFLDVVEGQGALAVEVSTTIEFLTGGGAYLPSLDDNFLADRLVTLPIIHIVTFDADGKILQVRQNWDQGSLLKLIDVIGKTGRNWPIRDGIDQIKLIASSIKSSGKAPLDTTLSQEDATKRSRTNSQNVTRDPHASLSLFSPREKREQDSLPAVVAPRASAKPPPRDYHDLFVGNDSDNSPATPNKTANQRAPSPSKSAAIAPKLGAGKNYAPSRLFDRDEETVRPSPQKINSNPTRYNHFDFADGSDAPEPSKAAPKDVKSKHGSQWNFEDFQTPQKHIPTKVVRTNDVRHWGESDEEVVDSPLKTKQVPKPRKDAETHFEFQDDGTPEGGPRVIGRPRGAGQNTGLSLYKNNLYDDDNGGVAGGDEPKQVKPIANVKDRRKDFDPHFSMTDDSPASKPTAEHIDQNRAKAVKMMDANWSAYDQSPGSKENVPTSPATSRPTTGTGKGPLVESTNMMSNRNDRSVGIKTFGDGMGGNKGKGRQWGFGDESDGEEAGGANKPGKYVTGKTQGKNQVAGGDFWDF